MAKKAVYQKVTIAQAVRDVLIASMNKGQFPLSVLALLMLAAMYKMPPEDVSRLVFSLVEGFKSGSLLGWVFGSVSLLGWFIHTRWQRRIFNEEIERLSLERSKLQERLLDGKIGSSE